MHSNPIDPSSSVNSELPDGVDDLPPPYSVLDEHPKAFNIQGCFIYTPAGPSHQLSSGLDQRGHKLFIRKLSPKESRQVTNPSAVPLPFDKSTVLYEITKALFTSKNLGITGRRKGTFQGSVEMKHGIRTWRVLQTPPGPNSVQRELITLKPKGSLFGSAALEWKQANGQSMANEGREGPTEDQSVPALKLSADLGTDLRDLLLTCWVARLWLINSQEKTREEGLQPRKMIRLANEL